MNDPRARWHLATVLTVVIGRLLPIAPVVHLEWAGLRISRAAKML
jgi:hypothetical protein